MNSPIRIRHFGCCRCGDVADKYVSRTTDNGLFRVSVCIPCAEIFDRQDEAKKRQRRAP